MSPPTPFSVAFTPSAQRDLGRLPTKVAAAAIEFTYGPLADRPTVVGKPLRLELEGTWSARRGDHRILYEIDEAAHRVVVLVIQHRSDAYRPR